jgi:hypothetical protein
MRFLTVREGPEGKALIRETKMVEAQCVMSNFLNDAVQSKQLA